jgi:membrane-bound serine protease (ClpP class)
MHKLGNSLLVVLGSGAVSMLGVVALSRYLGAFPILNRLILRTPSDDEEEAVDTDGKPLPPVGRYAAAVGDWGVAESPLRPAGKAIFGEEYLDVVTDGSFVERGAQVRIIEISGNRIVVREVDPK